MTGAMWEYRIRAARAEAQFRNPACKDEDHVACGCMWGKNVPQTFRGITIGPQAVKLLKPSGKPLAIYLPGYMARHTSDEATYAILDAMGRTGKTGNRGAAGATPQLPRGKQLRSYAVPIHSNIMGAFEPSGLYKTCRLTVYTAAHMEDWKALEPALQDVAAALQEHVPDRYAKQAEQAARTLPEWVIPGTPFTTVTVNHSYPTGVHTDKGDLDAGFSAIFAARRGHYTGGELCFPQYGVAVDLQDGDLILMDAHDYHGNTAMTCACGNDIRKPCKVCGAGRVSVVTYFRTKMPECGSAEAEVAKAAARAERRMLTDAQLLAELNGAPLTVNAIQRTLKLGDLRAARVLQLAAETGREVAPEELAKAHAIWAKNAG